MLSWQLLFICLVLGHTARCSELASESVLRDHSEKNWGTIYDAGIKPGSAA